MSYLLGTQINIGKMKVITVVCVFKSTTLLIRHRLSAYVSDSLTEAGT